MSFLNLPPVFPKASSPGQYKEDKKTCTGTSAKGTRWVFTTAHCQDYEDSDYTYTFTIDGVEFRSSDEYGRDWASNKVSVTHKEFGAECTEDGRCRDPGQSHGFQRTGDEGVARKALEQLAAREGVTVAEFIEALPGYFRPIVNLLQ